MRLTLALLRCPDAVTPEQRVVTGGEYSIGRGLDNDWVLPDPPRLLSKRHCVVAFHAGEWQVTDLSTNGTFINHEPAPIGNRARPLRTGDRLVLGAYEIEIGLEDEARDDPYAWERGSPTHDPYRPGRDNERDRFPPARGDAFPPARGEAFPPARGEAFPPARGDTRDPFGAGRDGGHDPFGPAHDDGQDPFGSARDSDRDPFGPAGNTGRDPIGRPGGVGDNPFASDADRDGRRRLPDDFDPFADDFAPVTPSAGRLRPDTSGHGYRLPSTQPDHDPAHEEAFQPPQAIVPLPDDWALDFPEPTPAPVRAAPTAPSAAPAARTPAARAPAPSAPATDDLLAAFLRGAKAEATRIDDPARAMETLGEVFRAMVVGLRQALIARLSIKGEFRIEQTMIRANGNNPLKFSADDDVALASLLGGGRRGGMPAAMAVTEALRDIQHHELATLAAMQDAVRALVARLDPAALERQAGQAGFQAAFGKLLNPGKVRAWDAFVALHGQISDALSDDFDSVFGRAFARAYEQALADIADQGPQR